MHTIAHIRTHGLDSLPRDLHISPRRHATYPNLVMLKYNQIFSPMDHPVVQECRGLILDEADNWRVISRPYDKFFNHGEPFAAPLDWSSARVYEKLDGSLMTLYFYRNQWHVASSGQPDAGGGVAESDTTTFRDLFWKTWQSHNYRLPEDTTLCYMFELLGPMNRIIVQHASAAIILHGARNLHTMAELDPHPIAQNHNWQCVKQFPIGNWEDLIASAAALNPLESEGYVVVDAHFHRLKIKNPRYVALAHLKENATPRRILELIQKAETKELLAYFPEMTAQVKQVEDLYETLCHDLEQSYEKIATIESQKDFAAQALKTRLSPALFAVRAKKSPTIRDFLSTAPIPLLMRTLNLTQPEDPNQS